MRDFANTAIRYNKLMKEEDKRYYGIHTPDPIPTPVPEPATYPEAEPDTSVIRQVTIRFWDSATRKRGKPGNLQFPWCPRRGDPLGPARPRPGLGGGTGPFRLRHRQPLHPVPFDETQRGQRLYFCLRWESTTNLKGPYGEIYSAVIP